MTDKSVPHRRRTDDRGTRSYFVHQRRSGLVGWFHRHRALIAYLILVLAIIWSLNSVRNEGIERRNDIAQATHQTLLASCERGNDTRRLLRDIISENFPALKRALRDHQISQVQYDRSLAANKLAVRKLHDVDCQESLTKISP